MDFSGNENPGEIVNNIRGIIHCPFCGSSYDENAIKVLGKVSRNHVMHLVCRECGNHIMASLTREEDRKNLSPENIFKLAQRGPISNDEVMDFVKDMAEFDGDFKKITKIKK